MKLPRDLGGAALVKVLSRKWQYRQVTQVGSHVILETEEPGHHRISGILRAVAQHKGVRREEILASL